MVASSDFESKHLRLIIGEAVSILFRHMRFFTSSGTKLDDFSFIQVDMHSHLLPQIDDGAVSVADTVQLLRGLRELGFSKFWTTPHVMADFFGNTKESISNSLRKTKSSLATLGLGRNLHASAEYYLDEDFQNLLERDELLPLPGNRVLVEWSLLAQPLLVLDVLNDLLGRGYIPVIAHPERYQNVKQSIRTWKELKYLGCELQVNLLSLCGHYGVKARKTAFQMLKEDTVAYLGTDCHCLEHVRRLYRVLEDRDSNLLLKQVKLRNKNFEFALK